MEPLNATKSKHQLAGIPAGTDNCLLLEPSKARASSTQKDKLRLPQGLSQFVSTELSIWPLSQGEMPWCPSRTIRMACQALTTAYTRDQADKATPFLDTAQPCCSPCFPGAICPPPWDILCSEISPTRQCCPKPSILSQLPFWTQEYKINYFPHYFLLSACLLGSHIERFD